MKFSLIIPCYNESENLPLLIKKCEPLTAKANVEIILVDNGSTDNSNVFLKKIITQNSNFKIVRVDVNRGYGFGILSGLRAAKGEILGWTHADMQTDPLDALKGLKKFTQDDKNLFVKGIRRKRPLMDVFFTIGMSIFETILLAKPMWDINAQPTLFSRSFFEKWSNPPDDFSLDLYAYYKAKKHGLKIRRFDVEFGKRAFGVSHWNVNWSSKVKFIIRTLRYSIKLKKNI